MTHEEKQKAARSEKRMRQRREQVRQGTVDYSRQEKLILAVVPLLDAGIKPDQIFEALLRGAEFGRMNTYSAMQEIVRELGDPEYRIAAIERIQGLRP